MFMIIKELKHEAEINNLELQRVTSRQHLNLKLTVLVNRSDINGSLGAKSLFKFIKQQSDKQKKCP